MTNAPVSDSTRRREFSVYDRLNASPAGIRAGLGDAALFLCLQRERRVVAQPRFRGPRFRGAGAPSSTLRRNDSSVSLVFGGPERRRSAATNFALQREFWLGSATHRLACANNLPAIPWPHLGSSPQRVRLRNQSRYPCCVRQRRSSCDWARRHFARLNQRTSASSLVLLGECSWSAHTARASELHSVLQGHGTRRAPESGRIDRMERRSSGMYRGPPLLQHYCAASRPPSDGFSDFCLALRCCVWTTSWNVHCASFAQQLCDWRTWSSYWPHGYALQLFSRESLCMSKQWTETLGVP